MRLRGDTEHQARARDQWCRAHLRHTSEARAFIGQVVSRLSPNSRLLDVGCATGAFLDWIGEELGGAVQLVGADRSLHGLHRAVSTCERWRAGLVQADPDKLPLSAGVFDVAISCLTPVSAEEVWRVLRPGGWYVAAGVDQRRHWGELEAAFGTRFQGLGDVRGDPARPLREAGFAEVETEWTRGKELLDIRRVMEVLEFQPFIRNFTPRTDRALIQELMTEQRRERALEFSRAAWVCWGRKPEA